jgi:hypothetical protein
MCYSCEKTATYNNIRVFYKNAKPAFHLSKSPRARIDFIRIRLITAHVTLAHATFNSRETAKFGGKKGELRRSIDFEFKKLWY